jgi:hypothetical protein
MRAPHKGARHLPKNLKVFQALGFFYVNGGELKVTCTSWKWLSDEAMLKLKSSNYI